MPKEQDQMPLPDINLGNEGLPDGAIKFQDIATAHILETIWQKEIDFYSQTQIPINAGLDVDRNNIPGLKKFEVEISDPQSSTFKGKLHPQVEGHSWYRGIAIKVDKKSPFKQIFIFSGWMQPWIENEAQAPIVYTVGEIPAQIVHNVIYQYASGILSDIDRNRIILLRGRDENNGWGRS